MRNLNVADVLISKDIKNIRRKKNDIKNFSFDGISTLPMYGTIAAAAAATSAGASTNQVSKIGEEEKTKLKPQTYWKLGKRSVFIGPESNYCLPLSVDQSVTDALETWMVSFLLLKMPTQNWLILSLLLMLLVTADSLIKASHVRNEFDSSFSTLTWNFQYFLSKLRICLL